MRNEKFTRDSGFFLLPRDLRVEEKRESRSCNIGEKLLVGRVRAIELSRYSLDLKDEEVILRPGAARLVCVAKKTYLP